MDRLPTQCSLKLDTFLERKYIQPIETVALEALSDPHDREQRHRVERMLAGTSSIPFDTAAEFPAATELRRTALRKGLRVSRIDCLILAVAGRRHVPLFTKDLPQAVLARGVGIMVENLPEIR